MIQAEQVKSSVLQGFLLFGVPFHIPFRRSIPFHVPRFTPTRGGTTRAPQCTSTSN